MSESELKLIDESIKAYKNMINYFKEQVINLERKKLKVNEACDECFKFKVSKAD